MRLTQSAALSATSADAAFLGRAAAWLLAIACTAPSSARADALLQIYFSADDPGPLPQIPNPHWPNYPDLATPAEFSGQVNPVLDHSTRLWIWANPLVIPSPGLNWLRVGFNIDADGPLRLSNLTLFNPNHFVVEGFSVPRWQQVTAPEVSADGSEYAHVDMAILTTLPESYGLRRPRLQDGYSDSAEFSNQLLGYFDVAYDGPGAGVIWLETQLTGHNFFPQATYLQYGFGDNPILYGGPNDNNLRSTLPEVTFIPEPAAGLLLVLAALARHRRDRSHA